MNLWVSAAHSLPAQFPVPPIAPSPAEVASNARVPAANSLRQQLTTAHDKYMDTLRKLSAHCRAETVENIRAVAAQFGLTLAPTSPADTGLARARVHFMTEVAVANGSTLSDFVRLVRGQTADDPCPNKDMYALPRSSNPELQGTFERWKEVVAHGVIPEWLPQRPFGSKGPSQSQLYLPASTAGVAAHPQRSI